MNSVESSNSGILKGHKFPNILFILISFGAFSAYFYLIPPEHLFGNFLIVAAGVTLIATILMTGGFRFRIRLTEKRLATKNITGDLADQVLLNKRREMIWSYYNTVFGFLLIGIIIHFLQLGSIHEMPFWEYIIIVPIAFGIPEIIRWLFIRVSGSKSVGN